MILVLAGTVDGRALAARLLQAGHQVLAAVISDYGRTLAELPGIDVHTGPLTAADMRVLITNKAITAIVDASHPYAAGASVNAMAACEAEGIQYIRYERAEATIPEYDRLYTVEDAGAAAKMAANLGRVIFLTTGSRALSIFTQEPALAGCRLIARVLPQPEVVAECIGLGFRPSDIVAMQGPFSLRLNAALFKEYNTEVIITKNSGTIGGADTKIAAAVELQLPIIVIGRPRVEYKNLCSTPQQVIDCIDVK